MKLIELRYSRYLPDEYIIANQDSLYLPLINFALSEKVLSTYIENRIDDRGVSDDILELFERQKVPFYTFKYYFNNTLNKYYAASKRLKTGVLDTIDKVETKNDVVYNANLLTMLFAKAIENQKYPVAFYIEALDKIVNARSELIECDEIIGTAIAHLAEYTKLDNDDIHTLIRYTMATKGNIMLRVLCKHQKLDFTLDDYGLTQFINNNWIYRTTEFKKKAIVDTKRYVCHDDYFIAYKGIRNDRYSLYNFQYKYLPGETYETWADYSSEECSFGFGVGTEKYAKEYYAKGLIIRCKVYYRDVARVVCGGEKIRCAKMTILE